ncbi:MAG: multidrug transporter ATP-binding protein [Friedmanniella sp.]|nr:multidrug transporter ATP-binding protein [Friedmanniella sp.]
MAARSVPAVRVDRLHVVRGGRQVLPGLTLEVPRGQVVGLLGPSGCGKSTLMRCIVGVQLVTGGSVEVLGRRAGHPDLRRRVGYLTQRPSVYPDLSVAENLRYFATVLGVRRGRVAAELERVVGLVDLAARLDTRVSRLSGGELCRVSLAAALLGTPELLVLDEPTVGLDPVLRRDLWAMFHRLAAAGATLLVSSHVMDEASRCDRLLLMRAGDLLADDTLVGLRSATGAADAESAFLTLVEAGSAARRPSGSDRPSASDRPSSPPDVRP